MSKVYHGDQLGSTRGLTNGSEVVTDSRDYDAFGVTVAASGTGTLFGFVGGQGYQTDPGSELMLLGARYYDPSVGRFISRDPIGYEGGLNLCGYCNNDPINGTDPTGHETHVKIKFPWLEIEMRNFQMPLSQEWKDFWWSMQSGTGVLVEKSKAFAKALGEKARR